METKLPFLVLAMGTGIAATPVQAQNVSISGYFDIGVYRNFDKVLNVGPIQRTSLTFSGSEDLGGGNKAMFRLQTRFEPDTGELEKTGKPFFHGEATVGLAGRYGTVRFGRALTAMWSQDWNFDPWYNFNRIASPAWQFWHYLIPTDRTSNSGNPEYGRLNSGIFYDSPDFNGFTLHLSGSPERTSSPGNGRSRSAALVYSKDGWGGMLAAERNGSGDRAVFSAAKATFGKLQLNGAYEESEMAGTDLKAKVFTLGGTYSIGASALKLGYGHLKLSGADTDFYGAGAEYNLSKRTMAYFSAGHYRPEVGANSTAYGVGIAHSF